MQACGSVGVTMQAMRGRAPPACCSRRPRHNTDSSNPWTFNLFNVPGFQVWVT